MGKYQSLNSDPELVFEWYLSKRVVKDFIKLKKRRYEPRCYDKIQK